MIPGPGIRMSTKLSDFTRSLRKLGEIEVTDWDLMEVLNTELGELEIGDALRRLGNRKVIDWDFETAMPTMHRLAHQEVHLAQLVRRAAHYKVMDWDFRSHGTRQRPGGARPLPSPAEIKELSGRIEHYLQFVMLSLIDSPGRAEIHADQPVPGVLRFRVRVLQKDLKTLIGREGATAAATRRLLKASAGRQGVLALLQLEAHEEQEG